MAKFTHHISWPWGVPTAGEQRGTEWTDMALVSASFLLPLPPILYEPHSHPPYCLLPASQRHRKALISMEEEVDRSGGALSTLIQLVRLIKRVCGLWVTAQTYQETGRQKTSLRYRNMLRSILKSQQDHQ